MSAGVITRCRGFSFDASEKSWLLKICGYRKAKHTTHCGPVRSQTVKTFRDGSVVLVYENSLSIHGKSTKRKILLNLWITLRYTEPDNDLICSTSWVQTCSVVCSSVVFVERSANVLFPSLQFIFLFCAENVQCFREMAPMPISLYRVWMLFASLMFDRCNFTFALKAILNECLKFFPPCLWLKLRDYISLFFAHSILAFVVESLHSDSSQSHGLYVWLPNYVRFLAVESAAYCDSTHSTGVRCDFALRSI